ncbi:nucleophosmin [Callorhinchus milii]|uniref:Nucleophosmin n=2 Tax=Callorhinchus milii TaxID=7868 RepID=K4GBZ8_CALMI|nr:nucleophosmin [Callorhinchus milii]AFK11271.1 nucleophosmin [Callorhinchus milii]AFM88249.1 nucleophosmin [Callorhinchus milii]AFM89798.1 nucleophosmin [Callorhinchus milii]AFM90884.1 nucleophosmin [Callorhinchus milii]AFM91029.1 nucleophosmin [Callorhinchus milii]|eukprot:gi/632948485/ref/XP_007889623.1/ PREDICTED: nucleophosmin [Callorhinchus milii]
MEDMSAVESMEALRPQSFLFGCELKEKKDYTLDVGGDDNEHQLSLRTVSLGVGASDGLHLVEAEALDYEGTPTKVVLAALKMSVQPTVSLGGFEITPPVTFRLKSGTGPVYISGQHLIALDEDLSSDEEEDDSMLENSSQKQGVKRPPPLQGSKTMQKKMKMEVEEEDDDEEDDDEDDDDDDEDIDDDEEEEEEKTPAKKPVQKPPAKGTPGMKATPNQNGKASNKSTPAQNKPAKAPGLNKRHQTPKTPKAVLSVEEIKAKLKSSVEKGSGLPKMEQKFTNFIKHGFRVEDPKVVSDLWTWRQSMKDSK